MLLLASLAVSLSEPMQGTVTHLAQRYARSSESSNGLKARSNGEGGYREAVVAVTPHGIELEYDLPDGSTADDRKREWLLPARIFYPHTGAPRRLDGARAEARLEAWLKAAGRDRSTCGRWLFTWTAFKIECDPDAIIEQVRNYQLRFLNAREGAPMGDALAGAPVPLRRNGKALTASLAVDPDKIRAMRAEADVVLGEVSGAPVRLEKAMAGRASERITGTISIRLDLATNGNVRRRTRLVTLESRKADGTTEKETWGEVTEAMAGR